MRLSHGLRNNTILNRVTGTGIVADPILNVLVYDSAPNPDTITWGTDTIGDIFILIDTNPTRTAAQVVAGGGVLSTNFPVTGTGGEGNIDTSGITDGNYYIHAVVRRASDLAYSAVVSEAVTIGTPTGYEAEAEAYFAAMSVQPDATRKGHINTLIAGLKTDLLWTKLDWLVLFAAHDEQAGRINLINPAKSMTAVNGPVFTVDRGFTGDTTTLAHTTAGEAFGAVGNKFALNSASAGVWCNLTGPTGQSVNQFGTDGSTTVNRCKISARTTVGTETFQINDATADVCRTTAAVGPRTGHRAVSRTGPAIKRAFLDGVLLVDLTTASTTIVGGNVTSHRSGTSYTNDRLSVQWWGEGLSNTDVANLHSRLNTFLTAIGAN